jgi:hypothetical protein
MRLHRQSIAIVAETVLSWKPRKHEVRRRRKCSEVEFLPDFHDFLAGDPEPWRSVDTQKFREALLQVDKAYQAALELFI